MIGRLQGLLVEKKPPFVLLDVQGVSYELAMPLSCLAELPSNEQPVLLYTHLSVREDGHFLYGFIDAQKRDLFRVLIKVSGIGPKMALAILSGLSVLALHEVIQANDATRFTKIPGIGKKTAERLLIELRDKLKQIPVASTTLNVSGSDDIAPQKTVIDDAVAALESLGYKPSQSMAAIKRTYAPHMNLESLIRQALQSML